MSANLLPTFQVMQFATELNLLLQQKGSKLRGAVTEGHYVGKQASPVDQIGAVEAQVVTNRFAPMGRVDAPTDRRWVFPTDYDLPQLIDSFDKLRMITQPESKYMTNAVYAMGRAMDRVILNSFLTTNYTGESGGTSTSFTAANEVDVAIGGANSRLNVAKLHAVRELILANHIDMDEDPVTAIITAKDDSALLQQIEFSGKDYKNGDAPVLRDGKIHRFLGINFVHCQLAETVLAGTNEVNIPVFAKSGMHLGIWQDVVADVSKRNDLQGMPWQLYVAGTFGATRLEETKVFNIESYR